MILIVSASTHPEPQFMAAASAKAGEDVLLATAASFASDELPMRVARSLPEGRLKGELLRRQLPSGLHKGQVLRAGYWWEVRQLWARMARGDTTAASQLRAKRDERLQVKVQRASKKLSPQIVIAQQHSAYEAFQSAGDATRVLAYPIAHHRWLAREMQWERSNNMPWGEYIDASDLGGDEELLAKLDREIAMADYLIVVSNFVKRTCVEFGVPESRIIVNPLASFPPPAADVEPPLGLFPENAKFKILFTGQIVQRKGVSYLVDAFDDLQIENASLSFLGAASSGMKALLRDRGFRVHDPVPRATLMAAARAADVVVLPSLGEGFPLTAIEAMAAGTPVIVSDATFGTDVVEDGVNGFVVPMRQVDDLRDRLQYLAADEERRNQMGQHAAVAAGNFTWPQYEERFLKILGQIRGETRE